MTLCIQGISHTYRGARDAALDDVSLTIPGGGVFGLLGPNGAGKTTLISLICGLIQADKGNILLDGEPLAVARTTDPTRIALVPQDHAFYPMLDVIENLRFFGGVLGLSGRQLHERCDAAIAFARLEQVTGKLAETLSGGLRRRLNLAIGLLGAPRLLLLDEPTVGVDPQSRHFLLDAIAGLPAAGTTVIYTSHYMEEVEAICQRLAILDQGKVLAEGTLNALLDSGEQTLELRLDRPMPDMLAMRYRAVTRGAHDFGLFLRSTAELPKILDELAEAGCEIRNLSLGKQNLEQVFMRLTRRSLRD